jgi:hypothetical protein
MGSMASEGVRRDSGLPHTSGGRGTTGAKLAGPQRRDDGAPTGVPVERLVGKTTTATEVVEQPQGKEVARKPMTEMGSSLRVQIPGSPNPFGGS